MVPTKTLLLQHYYRRQGSVHLQKERRICKTWGFWGIWLCMFLKESRAAQRGGFKRGVFPIWTCPSFFVLFGTFPIFRDFPDLSGDGPGIFPICPFPLSRPINSTYEEQSQKGPRHNLDLSRKKWEPPV